MADIPLPQFGTICVHSDQHCQLSPEKNWGSAERQGGVHMGLSKYHDAILSKN